MKLWILLGLLLPFGVFAQLTYEKNWSTALEKAKAKNQLIFIKYYNENCGVCKKTQEILNTPEVAKVYQNNFVCYAINTEKKKPEEEALLQKIGLEFDGVPIFIFVDANQQWVHHSGVKATKERLLQISSEASNPNVQSSKYQDRYQKGERNVTLLFQYAEVLKAQKNYEQLKIVTSELYQYFPKQNLSNNDSYFILKRVVTDTENGFFQYWYQNQKLLEGKESGVMAGKEKENLEKIVLQEIRVFDKSKFTTEKKKKLMDIIQKLGITNQPEVFFE